MTGNQLTLLAAVFGVTLIGSAIWAVYDPGRPASGGGSSITARINPDDATQVARGKTVYAETCAACHGEQLQGEPNWKQAKADGTLPAPPHDDSGHTWHHGDDFLYGYTKFGGQAYAPKGFQSAMPGFEGQLGDEDILAVLAFIKSRWSADARAQQARITAQSQ